VINQLLLNFGLRAQVATERDHPAFGTDRNGAKRNRDVGAFFRWDVDLPPDRAVIVSAVEQLGDFRPAFYRNNVIPGFADPAAQSTDDGQRTRVR